MVGCFLEYHQSEKRLRFRLESPNFKTGGGKISTQTQ